MSKILIFTIISLHLVNKLNAQEDYLIDNIESQFRTYQDEVLEEQKMLFGYSVGFSLDLGKQKNGSLRAYANVGFLQSISRGDIHILLGGQSHIEFYRGGVGTSLLNSERFKINIELRNSFTALMGHEANNHVVGKPAFANVGLDASALMDPLDYSFSLGTIFINGINHARHQRVGAITASINQFTFHYINDGGLLMRKLMLGDTYDRYWTGAGQIGFYFKSDNAFLTDFILRFDNYTGYQPNLYEVGSILKIDNLPYIKESEQLFNQARFVYKLGFRNSIYFNVSVYAPKFTDIQNIIHYHFSISPFHARSLPRRMNLGLEYKYDFKFHDK